MRASTAVLLLAAAAAAGAALTAGLGGWDVVDEIQRHGAFGGFSVVCR
jgi:hypothetical protein